MRCIAATIASLIVLAAPAGARELGLNVHQSPTVGMKATHDAGLKWVRLDLNWLDMQPTNAAPDFTRFDMLVDAAGADGLSVLGVLAYTPAWASTGDTKSDGSTNDVPQAGAYAAFVTAAVTHFGSKIAAYELWNEPNLAQFWEGTTQQYLDLVLSPGADAVHAACAGCLVVGPGLATVGTAYADWMDAVLSGYANKLDVVSGHDYAGFPASGSTIGTTSDSFFNKLDSHRVVTVGGAVIYEGPLSFHEVMVKHNVQKPFWMTETGIEAALGDTKAETDQTAYYQNVLDAMASRPWWTTTIFYEGFDEPPAMYHFGVVVDNPSAPAGYDPKPVFDLLKQAATEPPPDLAVAPSDGGVAGDDGGAIGGGGSGGESGGAGNGGGGSGGSGMDHQGCSVAPGSGALPAFVALGLAVALALVARRRTRS